MSKMTWRELRDKLNSLTDEQLDTDVTIADASGEFHPMDSFAITDETDVLDAGHPYIFYFG